MAAWLEPLEGGRCQKWKLRVTAGSRGARRNYSKRFDGGKREATAALKAFEQEVDGMPTEEAPTFASYAQAWNYGRYSVGSISKSTYDNYRHVLDGLSAHLGNKKLTEIAVKDIETACSALKLHGHGRGKPWHNTTLRTALKVSRKMYADAMARGMATANPFMLVEMPRNDTAKRKALNLEESSALLDALDVEDAHQFAVALMLCTGMRAGECVGVRWSDVTDAGIAIDRDVTKTDSGERIVPLTRAGRELVNKRRRYVETFLAQVGARLDGTEHLCCTADGRPLTYNAMKHWWANHRADYGLDGWTLHEMRHTFATNLAQANVHPSTMASLLGHSSSEITMEIYTHVHQEDMRLAMDALEQARGNVHPDVHPPA